MTNWSVAEASIRCATLLAELLEIFTSNGDYFRQNLLGSTFAGPKDTNQCVLTFDLTRMIPHDNLKGWGKRLHHWFWEHTFNHPKFWGVYVSVMVSRHSKYFKLISVPVKGVAETLVNRCQYDVNSLYWKDFQQMKPPLVFFDCTSMFCIRFPSFFAWPQLGLVHWHNWHPHLSEAAVPMEELEVRHTATLRWVMHKSFSDLLNWLKMIEVYFLLSLSLLRYYVCI